MQSLNNELFTKTVSQQKRWIPIRTIHFPQSRPEEGTGLPGPVVTFNGHSIMCTRKQPVSMRSHTSLPGAGGASFIEHATNLTFHRIAHIITLI